MTAPIRILCVGSPFGDDAVGMRAAELLRRLVDVARAEVSYLDRPGAGLIESVRDARAVILVDGVRSGAPVGTLHRIEGAPIYRQLARHTSTHGFGLADSLALADRLGYRPQVLVLHGVEIEPGRNDLNPAVQAALPGLVAAVQAEVAALAGAGEGSVPAAGCLE
jgi:hydrogenase maturation protease